MLFEEKYKTKTLHNFFLVFLFIFFGFVFTTNAASLSLKSPYSSYAVGDSIKVTLSVESSDKSVNAVSGTLQFPTKLLQLSSISKSGSVITLWAKEPSYSNSTGTASFEGVILNGFQGARATVLTFTFKAKAVGNANIVFGNNTAVLANDGQGTNVVSNQTPVAISIREALTPPATPSESSGITITPTPNDDTPQGVMVFTVTANDKKEGAPYTVAIDGGQSTSWTDDGSHFYETSPLSPGAHTIVFTTLDSKGNEMTNSNDFTVSGSIKPEITEYQQHTTEGQYLVLKGKADPKSFVTVYVTQISAQNDTAESLRSTTTTILANSAGKFVFVSNTKMSRGEYVVTVQSKSTTGVQSELSDPVKIIVQQYGILALGRVALIAGALGILILLSIIFIQASRIRVLKRKE